MTTLMMEPGTTRSLVPVAIFIIMSTTMMEPGTFFRVLVPVASGHIVVGTITMMEPGTTRSLVPVAILMVIISMVTCSMIMVIFAPCRDLDLWRWPCLCRDGKDRQDQDN